MSAVQQFRDELPFLACHKCGADEFTVVRNRMKIAMAGQDIVVNLLECARCGHLMTVLP